MNTKDKFSLHLLSSPVEFSAGSDEYTGEADFELLLSPVPHIVAEIKLHALEHPLQAFALALGRPKVDLRILATNSEIRASIVGGGTEPPRVDAQIVESAVDVGLGHVDALRSLVLNFPSFITPIDTRSLYINSVELISGEWKVEIQSAENSDTAFERLNSHGGYAITHQCLMSRLDGQTIDPSDVRPFLTGLRYFLSFSAGRWITLPYCNALGEASTSQWWDLSPCAPWRHVPSWFDVQHGDHLRTAFDGFFQRWRDPIWESVLRRAIFWFISSNDSTGIDGSLILSQTALEFLTWFILTEDRRLLTRKQFRETRASDRIGILLRELGIDTSIPSHLTELPSVGLTDGPEAIVRLRNALVHPDARQFTRPTSPDVKVDAWQLAQWYIELIILRECGYTGQYGNRLRRRLTGDIEDLPWH